MAVQLHYAQWEKTLREARDISQEDKERIYSAFKEGRIPSPPKGYHNKALKGGIIVLEANKPQ